MGGKRGASSAAPGGGGGRPGGRSPELPAVQAGKWAALSPARGEDPRARAGFGAGRAGLGRGCCPGACTEPGSCGCCEVKGCRLLGAPVLSRSRQPSVGPLRAVLSSGLPRPARAGLQCQNVPSGLALRGEPPPVTRGHEVRITTGNTRGPGSSGLGARRDSLDGPWAVLLLRMECDSCCWAPIRGPSLSVALKTQRPWGRCLGAVLVTGHSCPCGTAPVWLLGEQALGHRAGRQVRAACNWLPRVQVHV